jgi:chromosome segregation ATPase
MIEKIKDWLTNNKVTATVIGAAIAEYLLVNNFNSVPTTAINEFFKTYTGLISILVAGIPTWALLSANYSKVRQETRNLASQQDLTIAQTLDVYNKQLASEIERNSHTLASMQAQISLRDARIDELAGEKDMRTRQIAELTTNLSLQNIEIEALKKTKVVQDERLVALENALAEEEKARLQSETELTRLKLYSEKIVKDNQVLTDRVKVLEDYIRANNFPVPSDYNEG